MRFLIFVLAFLIPGTSFAADMPVKAPVSLNVVYPYTGSGWYGGLSSLVDQTNPTINGTVQTGLQATGASIGGVVGYRWAFSPTIAFALENGAYYNNLGGSSICNTTSCNVASKFTDMARAKLIVPASVLLAAFPSLGLPNVPTLPTVPGLQVNGTHTYVFGGALMDDVSSAVGLSTGREWQAALGFGAGVEAQLSNGTALDFWAGYFNPIQGFSVGPVPYVTEGRRIMAGASWLF